MTDADTGAALLAAILANPDEDTPRLEYADWLQERGGAGDAERAELIRVQVELAGFTPSELCVYNSKPHYRKRNAFDGRKCITHAQGGRCRCRGEELRRREQELWLGGACFHILDSARPVLPAEAVVYRDCERPGHTPRRPEAYVTRGFIESLCCPADDWLAHADAILAAHPVRRVVLTTHPTFNLWQTSAGYALGNGLGPRRFTYAEIGAEVDRRFPDRPIGYMAFAILSLCWPGVAFELPLPRPPWP